MNRQNMVNAYKTKRTSIQRRVKHTTVETVVEADKGCNLRLTREERIIIVRALLTARSHEEGPTRTRPWVVLSVLLGRLGVNLRDYDDDRKMKDVSPRCATCNKFLYLHDNVTADNREMVCPK